MRQRYEYQGQGQVHVVKNANFVTQTSVSLGFTCLTNGQIKVIPSRAISRSIVLVFLSGSGGGSSTVRHSCYECIYEHIALVVLSYLII